VAGKIVTTRISSSSSFKELYSIFHKCKKASFGFRVLLEKMEAEEIDRSGKDSEDNEQVDDAGAGI
jgi:hypothetical protein